MGVEVGAADGASLEDWDGCVERSPHGTVFHQLESLRLLAAHSGTTLHPLVGHKGREPVGLFPVFEKRVGPVRAAFSPPPDLRIPYLGPALANVAKLKRRKRDRRHHEFVSGCLEWIEREIGPRYVHLRTGVGYDDLRPFLGRGWDVTPEYTYVVDLAPGRDDVLAAFSSDARSNIRDASERSYRVEVGGADAIGDIIEQVGRRYEAQGLSYRLDAEFVAELYDRLPEEQVRPYRVSVDGEFVGGLVALEYGDTVFRWQGGVQTGLDVDLSVNDVLDWHVMERGMDRGLAAYDLVGANTAGINQYKAKFGPDLRTYYRVERGSGIATRLARLYKKLH